MLVSWMMVGGHLTCEALERAVGSGVVAPFLVAAPLSNPEPFSFSFNLLFLPKDGLSVHTQIVHINMLVTLEVTHCLLTFLQTFVLLQSSKHYH